jgi:hypothetical protein
MGKNPGKEDEMVSWMVYMVPIVAIVATFTFTAIAHWVDSQRKEREAFYKSETLRRITEASGEGAKAALELLREDERIKQVKQREGLKIGGLICVATGIGLTALLVTLVGAQTGSPYLVGLIPGLIGVAMLVYVYLMAPPIEQGPKG